MARHLRRKHPHLYRSSDTAPTATTGVERVYTGIASGSANPFVSPRNVASTSGYSTLSLRPPFEGAMSTSPALRAIDHQRLISEPLERPTTLSDLYSRDSVPRSPRGSPLAQWNACGPSRASNASPLSQALNQSDGYALQNPQHRFNYSLKEEEPEYHPHSGVQPSMFSNPGAGSGAVIGRRAFDAQNAAAHRPEWMEAPPSDHRGGQGSGQLFHWDQQSGQTSSVHTYGSGGSTSIEAAASGSTARSLCHDQRDDGGQTGYFDTAYSTAPLPSGLVSAVPHHQAADHATHADVLQSEFFVGTMWVATEDPTFGSQESGTLPQLSEQVRIEPPAATGHYAPNNSVLLSGSSVSTSPRPIAAPFLSLDLRNLSDHTSATASAPPNPTHVEQIMAELGLTLTSSQSSMMGASNAFSSSTSFLQPANHAPAASLNQPQPTTTSAMHVHQNSQSQVHSSQSSVYLPNLTESQSEYLGPNASSHRRTMDRVWSTASAAFDANSQTRPGQGNAQAIAEDYDESLGRQVSAALKLESQSQDDMVVDPNANFTKPHDLFPSQRAAAWDEEGERKSARAGDGKSCFPPASSGAVMPTGANSAMVTMGPPRQGRDAPSTSHSQSHRVEMEVDGPSLSTEAQPGANTAATSGTTLSDQMQLIVDRFRVFARLCQDHLHPSSRMLESLAPLVPKLAHTDAPFFHLQMIGSPKAHSPEEALTVLSLASLQSDDASIREEGHRLICLMWCLVMVSHRHALRLGGRMSLLNCFLLVSMYGVRHNASDLWVTCEGHRETILSDALKAQTCLPSHFDTDQIDSTNLDSLSEEQLALQWSRWYEHESRKRTLLLCVILDSQSAAYFSPLHIDLSARPSAPQCQFLFAHIHEPCPDALFLAWPPRAWAARLTTSPSPSSAEGTMPSIASRLSALFRPHLALPPAARPRFRPSFDFNAHANGGPSYAPYESQDARMQASSPPASARSSRPPSRAGATEPRIVSQLYMYALLEGVHGAWMADSGFYESSAFGAAAVLQQLAIDSEGFNVEHAGISDLPGWRNGRSMDATHIAHALMNWSEMFSGGNAEDAGCGGIKLTDDVHCLTIRCQAIFLGLCTPLHSICAYLNPSTKAEQRKRLTQLLVKWVESPYCRRALVHAGTILTLISAAKTGQERMRPATAHAAYMALTVVVCTWKVLNDMPPSVHTADSVAAQSSEELVSTKAVWSTLLPSVHQNETGNTRDDSPTDDDWLRVRFWHRRFQYLGLAGIFSVDSESPLADWRPSTSASAMGSFARPRWSSFAGERRGLSRVQSEADVAHRRASHVQLPARQEESHDLRRQLLSGSGIHPATRTRQWILKGDTRSATFCGLALNAEGSGGVEMLGRGQLWKLVMWVRNDNPAWCFSGEYTELLLGALEETQTEVAPADSAEGNEAGCTV
ncbi:hypothetical protein PSEUBRA_004680 [Kalmanozyma brasiliensis GHG001]|nr:uncharacterized protein PSEUBRA_004680 [Kalmanozyma brasiliensis GHG001]EST05675.2 hypothetical protein PSEUBRA_004680 [Kalmanozyma brasiliensis GHG001]